MSSFILDAFLDDCTGAGLFGKDATKLLSLGLNGPLRDPYLNCFAVEPVAVVRHPHMREETQAAIPAKDGPVNPEQ
jgi:hypothetical protein